MHEQRAYFEISEANSLIPTLEYFFAELARLQRDANSVMSKAEKLGIKLSLDGKKKTGVNKIRDKLQGEFEMLTSSYAEVLDEVHELGVIIEDPDLGTVNFYSWVDGEEVILSWQYGEPEIKHWFKVTEDFMARRSLTLICEKEFSQPQVH